MEISIIIPVYNVDSFIGQCIESVLMQSFKDYEIILINDASKDNSLEICQKFQRKDNRIKIINKSINEGVEKARFDGLQIAQGKYVTFIDSDDWLENTQILSILYQKAEETGVDYVEMGSQRVMDRHKWIKKKGISPVTGYIQNPELFDKYYLSFFGVNILSITIWGKLYRKSTIEKANIKLSGLAMGEDLAFNLQLFPHLKSIYILDTIGYNYRFGGMTSKYNQKLYPNLKQLYLEKEKLIEKYNYQKAFDYIRIEIKNVLRSDICQRIIFKQGTTDEIKTYITSELNDSIWERVLQIKEHPNFLNDPFVKAIQKKDANEIYNICQNQVNKDKYNRAIKKIASFIFMHL